MNTNKDKKITILYKELSHKIVGCFYKVYNTLGPGHKKVIVEIKSVLNMPKVFKKQLYYYLKTSGYRLGYLVNFGADKIDIRRRVN